MEKIYNDYDTVDVCFLASMGSLCLGVVFTTIALILDSDITVNNEIPAREMEALEMQQQNALLAANVNYVIGCSLVAFGGATLLLAIVVMALRGEITLCRSSEESEDKKTEEFKMVSDIEKSHSYGTNE